MVKIIDVNILKRVYYLAKERSKEVNTKKYIYHQISNDKEKELIDYLNALTFEEVKDIQTIMYLGRDKDYIQTKSYEERFKDYRDYLDSLGWSTKQVEINQIAKKVPLNEYILEGAKILNLNLL